MCRRLGGQGIIAFFRTIGYDLAVMGVCLQMKRIFLFAFVSIFLLQGTLWACFSSSSNTVIKAVPMACCASICQKNTTEQHAQTICIQTALQTNKIDGFIKNAQIDQIDRGFPLVQLSQCSIFLYSPNDTAITTANDHPQQGPSLPLYLASHAFLI
jgi:hypothetical protein